MKRDDLTNPVYGGNKVRKLEHLLAQAKERGARRLVTVGAAGSHHVLATTYFGQRAGFEVEAVLVPQPRTAHVVDVMRADLALGLRTFPVSSWSRVPWAVLVRVAHGARFIPVGGSSVVGAMGYVDAAKELEEQVRAGLLPPPDVCVVALGSGGTAGGLAAGFEAADPPDTRRRRVRERTLRGCSVFAAGHLARACARRIGAARPRLAMDTRFLGAGYGHATPEGDMATALAREHAGLTLDPTYTAKTFASALWFVRARRAKNVLYCAHALQRAGWRRPSRVRRAKRRCPPTCSHSPFHEVRLPVTPRDLSSESRTSSLRWR